MVDIDDEDQDFLVRNARKNPIVPDAISPEPFIARECFSC